MAVVLVLGIFALPHLSQAVQNLKPLEGGFFKNWNGFVGVVLALSGVEAIANSTGVMKLNPGCTDANPNVSKTSTRAILWILLEVCVFTALLSLAMHSFSDLTPVAGEAGQPNDVNAPGHPGVRDYMLRYMGEQFVGGAFHSIKIGHFAGIVVSVVFGFLLLSAVNTAIVALVGISFLMSRDEEPAAAIPTPEQFWRPKLWLGGGGCRSYLSSSDGQGCGRIGGPVRRGCRWSHCDESWRQRHGPQTWARPLGTVVMFCTFLIMLAIEISLFAVKPNARIMPICSLTDIAGAGPGAFHAGKDGCGGEGRGGGAGGTDRLHHAGRNRDLIQFSSSEP